MKTITKTYKVYNYNELSDEAKEKVQQHYLDDPIRNDLFYEDCMETIHSLFPQSDLKVQYSLSFCQGDGFNIYGKMDMKDALKNINLIVKEKVEEYIDACGFNIDIPMNLNYTYSKANDISFADVMIDYLIDNNYENIDKELIYKFESKTKEMIEQITSALADYEKLVKEHK